MTTPHRAVLALICGLAITSACNDGRYRVGNLGSLEASPELVSFVIDTVPVGERMSQQVVLRNVGLDPVTVTAMHLEDVTVTTGTRLPVVVAVDLATTPPFEVAPGQLGVVPVSLSYDRTDDLPRKLNLVVTSTDPLRPKLTVRVEVVRAASQLIANPSPVVFTAADGAAPEKSLRLINNGLVALSLHSIRVADEAAFSLVLAGRTIESSVDVIALDPPVVIAANSEIVAKVRFAPIEARTYEGRLILFGDGPNTSSGFEVRLVGNEAGPCIQAHPGRVDFALKAPDSVSVIGVQLENCGDAPLDIDEIRLSADSDANDTSLNAFGVLGASSDRFALIFGAADPVIAAADGRGAMVLAPGATVDLPVRYAAGPEEPVSVAGAVTPDRGHIVVRSNARAAVQVIAIEGTTERGPEPIVVEPVFPEIPGCEYDGDTGRLHDVQIKIAGDDNYNAWLDGEALPARVGNSWYYVGTYDLQMAAGCYTLAIEAWDSGGVLSGLIASVKVDGVVRWVSGDNLPEWIVTGPAAPPTDWFSINFVPDPETWKSPSQCSSSATTAWGSSPPDILADGARWVWWTSDCRTLSRGFFRLTFTVD